MRKTVLLCAALAFAVSGCAGESGGSGNATAPVPAKKAGAKVLASDDDFGAIAGAAGLPTYNDPSLSRVSGLDAAIVHRCRPPPQIVRGQEKGAVLPLLLVPVAMAVIGWVANYAVTKVSDALQQEIRDYSATSSGKLLFGPAVMPASAGAQTYFYKQVPTAAGGTLSLGWNCVRLQRLVVDKTDKTKKAVASEAIFQVEIAPTGDLLVIRPLRLYFDQPAAKVDSDAKGLYGVSLGLQFDGAWQASANGEGKAATVWSVTDAVKQSIKISDPNFNRFYYYNLEAPAVSTDPPVDDPADKTAKPISQFAPQQVPLVPWSAGPIAGSQGGVGTLTISMGETSPVPEMLNFFAGLVKTNSTQISGLLASAAEAALGLSSSSSSK